MQEKDASSSYDMDASQAMHMPRCQHSHASKQMLAERSLYRKLLFTSEIIIYVRKTLSAR